MAETDRAGPPAPADAIPVGHSTGGGGVTRHIGRHGTKRVAAAVLAGAVPTPKTAAHPGKLPHQDALNADPPAFTRG